MKKCVIVLDLPQVAAHLADRLQMPLIAGNADALMKSETPFVTEQPLQAELLSKYGYWPVVIQPARNGMPEWKRTPEGSFLHVDVSSLHEGTLYSWLHEELYS